MIRADTESAARSREVSSLSGHFFTAKESSAATGDLLVAFELSQRWWKVGFTTGMGHRVRTRRIAAGALEAVAEAIADAKQMFGLAAEARVISCYEAGREGFWLHI
jgi:transposase